MITYAEELLKKNAPLIFVDYAVSQLNKLTSRLYELEANLPREEDEGKKRLITSQIESIKKDMEFFQGEKRENDGWKLVGNDHIDPADFEREMDEEMAKIKVDDLKP